MTSTKSYDIAKRVVWEAYPQVKANRGSAGIDEETIADVHQFSAGSECRCVEAYAAGGAGLAHLSTDTGDPGRTGEAM